MTSSGETRLRDVTLVHVKLEEISNALEAFKAEVAGGASVGEIQNGIPSKLGNHFGDGEAPVREIAEFCRTLVNEALTDVSNPPLTVSDPHWFEKAEDWLEKSEGK